MFWHSSLPVPKPGRNEVLIKVASSSVNPIDYRITESHTMYMTARKNVVGKDLAGTIVAIGRNVTGLSVGDKVFGFGSGYANYALAKSAQVTRIPDGIELDEFGVYANAATGAYQALKTHWFDRPNYTVRSLLIVGASGGVGSSLIQIARALGGPEVRIYALCSSKNVDYCRQLGANESIDYSVRNFDLARTLPIHSLDLIIDVVSGVGGHPNYVSSGMLLLKNSGSYVAFNSASRMDWIRASLTNLCGLNVQKSRYNLFTMNQSKSAKDLESIAQLVSQGKFRLLVSEEIPLTETPIRRALHLMKQGHVRGKIKIKPEQVRDTTA